MTTKASPSGLVVQSGGLSNRLRIRYEVYVEFGWVDAHSDNGRALSVKVWGERSRAHIPASAVRHEPTRSTIRLTSSDPKKLNRLLLDSIWCLGIAVLRDCLLLILPSYQAGGRGLSVEEKRVKLLEIFHETVRQLVLLVDSA